MKQSDIRDSNSGDSSRNSSNHQIVNLVAKKDANVDFLDLTLCLIQYSVFLSKNLSSKRTLFTAIFKFSLTDALISVDILYLATGTQLLSIC